MAVRQVFTRRYPKRLAQVLTAVIIVTSAALVVVFIGYRQLDDNPAGQVLPFLGEGGIALHRVHQEATRNGVVEWRLDADAVRYMDGTKQAVLEAPSVTFFLKNRDRVRLKAEQGRLDTESKDIGVTDNVVMDHGRYSLETDTLYYEHETRRIYAKTPVKISSGSTSIRADTMVLDLHTNRTVFRGNIKGTFRETL